MRRSLTHEAEILEIRRRLISALFGHRDGKLPLGKWLGILYEEVLRPAFDEEPGLADEKENFEALLEASAEGALRDYTVEIFGNQGRSPDQINLMTLHNSKGLEFETVFLVGLEDGLFPSKYDNTQEKLDEKRRLFYVGLTRAKTIVHLMYAFSESVFIKAVRKATGG